MRVLAVLTIAFLFYAAGVLRLADLGWKVDLDLPPNSLSAILKGRTLSRALTASSYPFSHGCQSKNHSGPLSGL